mmetsp:Transcript_8792/g.22600  ORF Transcript_8792/g.22600 Transcript_8792/m.22600 type:complete len:188 (+) Transcript_8792:479-1042(+)
MEPSTVAGPRCDSGRRHQALAKLKNRRAAGSADGEGQQGAPDQHGTEAPSSSDTNQERAAAILQPSAPIPGVGPLSRTVKQLVWLCEECGNECVPIREESRCLCGHRMKEHEKADHSNPYQCKNTRCSCKGFFLIVAEGSWVLRCRCHPPVSPQDQCKLQPPLSLNRSLAATRLRMFSATPFCPAEW